MVTASSPKREPGADALSFAPHCADFIKVLDALSSSPHGLSPHEVQDRQRRFGPNRLKPPPKPSIIKIIGRQFANAMSIVLSESGYVNVAARGTTCL